MKKSNKILLILKNKQLEPNLNNGQIFSLLSWKNRDLIAWARKISTLCFWSLIFFLIWSFNI